MAKIKQVLLIIWEFIIKIWGYITLGLSKVGHILTNNFIIRSEGTNLILFSKFKFKVTRKRRQAVYGLIFILPWIIGYILFSLYPVIHSLSLSFTRSFYNINTGMQSTSVGFNNYLNIFRNQTLLPLYVNYLTKMVIAVPLIIVFSLIIALLINQPIKGKGIWRMIFFLPVIISSGPILNELVNQGATTLPTFEDSEFVASLLVNFSPWMATAIESILSQLLLVLWYAGVPILIFLASLQKIDKSIYEASAIDGASPWDNFWKITLPSIKPFISVNIIYVVVSMSMFAEQGGILEIARNHMLYGTQESTVLFGYGYSAAISWLYFILMVIIILV